MAVANPYEVMSTEVLEVIRESASIKTFILRPQCPFSFQTGQFIELTLPGDRKSVV